MMETNEVPKWAIWVIVCVAVLLIFVTQWPALHAEVRPSSSKIFRNPFVVGVGIGANPFSPFIAQLGTTGLAHYRPLTTWSFRFNYGFSASKPAGYRVVNSILHAASTILLITLILGMTRQWWMAAAVGLLFAVHPIASSVVSTLSGRDELLSTLFLLWAWKLHLRRQSEMAEGKENSRRLPCLAVYLAALLSGENAVIFLGLVLLSDSVFRGVKSAEVAARSKLNWSSLITNYGGYLLTTVLFVVWKYALIGVRPWAIGLPVEATDNPIVNQSLAMSLVNGLKIALLYLFRIVWIAPPLGDLYDYVPVTTLADFRLLAALIGVIALIFFAKAYSARNPLALAPAWIFILGIVPALNIFGKNHDAMADRHLYFPIIALALALALLGRYLRRRLQPARLVSALGVALILVFTGTAFRNNMRAATDIGRLKALHELEPDEIKVTAHLSQSIWASTRGREAVSLLEALVQRHPESALALSELARAKANAGEIDEATRILNSAKKIKPVITEPFLFQGNIYELSGKTSAAVKEYKEALEIEPNSARAYAFLGALYQRQGRDDEAYQNFQSAAAIDPGSATYSLNLGAILMSKGQAESALAYSEKAFKLDPSIPRVYLGLAGVYAALGQEGKALKLYEDAQRLFGNQTQIVAGLGASYVESKQFDKAVSLYQSVLRDHPKDSRFLLYLGNAYRAAGATEPALQQYRKIIENDPDSPGPYMSMGYLYTKQARYDEAIEAYRKVAELQADNASVYFNLGNVYRAAKRYPLAVKSYQRALQINPKYTEAYMNLANTHEEAGNIPEAIKNYEEFQKLWKGDPNVKERVRRHVREITTKYLSPR